MADEAAARRRIRDRRAATRILVVDDNEEVARMCASMIALEGYAVALAYDGLKGLSEARRTVPDLIVLNVMMPGLSGVEVAKKLRADSATAHVKLLMTSGHSPARDSCLRAGADEFLDLPFTKDQLLAALEKLLAEH